MLLALAVLLVALVVVFNVGRDGTGGGFSGGVDGVGGGTAVSGVSVGNGVGVGIGDDSST